MWQEAPYPHALAELVKSVRYRPGWTVTLIDDLGRDYAPDDHRHERAPLGSGMTLDITTQGYNSYHPERGQTYSVHHYFIVPAATWNKRSWRRWLFDQFVKVETHEAMEFFQIVYEGEFVNRQGETATEYVERPYAPHHGPGEDPYIIFEHGTDEDRRMSFRGEMNG